MGSSVTSFKWCAFFCYSFTGDWRATVTTALVGVSSTAHSPNVTTDHEIKNGRCIQRLVDRKCSSLLQRNELSVDQVQCVLDIQLQMLHVHDL